MPDPTSPFDPYASPLAAAPCAGVYRPGALTALCILAIILGALGFFTAVLTSVSLVAGRQMQRALTPPQPGLNQEAVKLQQEMNAKMMDVVDDFRVYNFIVLLVHLVLAMSLIIGGVMTLRLNATGRAVLLSACWLAVVFELGRGLLQAFIQTRNFAVMREYMPRVMNAAGQGRGAPGGGQFMESMVDAMVWMSLGFMAILIILKVVYYVITIVYLRRPAVGGLFDSSVSEWQK